MKKCKILWKVSQFFNFKTNSFVFLFIFEGSAENFGFFCATEVNYINLVLNITAKPRKNTLNFKNLHHQFATTILFCTNKRVFQYLLSFFCEGIKIKCKNSPKAIHRNNVFISFDLFRLLSKVLCCFLI